MATAQPTTAHTEAPGGAHGGAFPPFRSETFASQLFWFALFFVLLYVLMARIGLPRVRQIIERRQGQIESDLAEAERLRKEADEALAAYEKALADARTGAQAIANEMHEKLNEEAERARKKLEEELNVKLADAETTITATKQAAMANVRTIAGEATQAIVERLIGVSPPSPTVDTALDEVLKR